MSSSDENVRRSTVATTSTSVLSDPPNQVQGVKFFSNFRYPGSGTPNLKCEMRISPLVSITPSVSNSKLEPDLQNKPINVTQSNMSVTRKMSDIFRNTRNFSVNRQYFHDSGSRRPLDYMSLSTSTNFPIVPKSVVSTHFHAGSEYFKVKRKKNSGNVESSPSFEASSKPIGLIRKVNELNEQFSKHIARLMGKDQEQESKTMKFKLESIPSVPNPCPSQDIKGESKTCESNICHLKTYPNSKDESKPLVLNKRQSLDLKDESKEIRQSPDPTDRSRTGIPNTGPSLDLKYKYGKKVPNTRPTLIAKDKSKIYMKNTQSLDPKDLSKTRASRTRPSVDRKEECKHPVQSVPPSLNIKEEFKPCIPPIHHSLDLKEESKPCLISTQQSSGHEENVNSSVLSRPSQDLKEEPKPQGNNKLPSLGLKDRSKSRLRITHSSGVTTPPISSLKDSGLGQPLESHSVPSSTNSPMRLSYGASVQDQIKIENNPSLSISPSEIVLTPVELSSTPVEYSMTPDQINDKSSELHLNIPTTFPAQDPMAPKQNYFESKLTDPSNSTKPKSFGPDSSSSIRQSKQHKQALNLMSISSSQRKHKTSVSVSMSKIPSKSVSAPATKPKNETKRRVWNASTSTRDSYTSPRHSLASPQNSPRHSYTSPQNLSTSSHVKNIKSIPKASFEAKPRSPSSESKSKPSSRAQANTISSSMKAKRRSSSPSPPADTKRKSSLGKFRRKSSTKSTWTPRSSRSSRTQSTTVPSHIKRKPNSPTVSPDMSFFNPIKPTLGQRKTDKRLRSFEKLENINKKALIIRQPYQVSLVSASPSLIPENQIEKSKLSQPSMLGHEQRGDQLNDNKISGSDPIPEYKIELSTHSNIPEHMQTPQIETKDNYVQVPESISAECLPCIHEPHFSHQTNPDFCRDEPSETFVQRIFKQPICPYSLQFTRANTPFPSNYSYEKIPSSKQVPAPQYAAQKQQKSSKSVFIFSPTSLSESNTSEEDEGISWSQKLITVFICLCAILFIVGMYLLIRFIL